MMGEHEDDIPELSEEQFRKLMDDHREEAEALARWMLWPETYPDPRGKYGNYPFDKAGATGSSGGRDRRAIGITPAMLAAGVSAFERHRGDVEDLYDPSPRLPAFLRAIYRAMAQLAPSKSHTGSTHD